VRFISRICAIIVLGALGYAAYTALAGSTPRDHRVDATTDSDPPILTRLLKPRRSHAEHLAFAGPPDIIRTADKLKQFAKRDPEAFAEVMRNRGPGGVVIYDPRTGVTREEYDRFRRAKELGGLMKVGDVTLAVSRPSPAKVVVSGMPEMPSVEFDLVEQTVSTPYGSLEVCRAFEPNENQHLTGPIRGVSWRAEWLGSPPRGDLVLWSFMVAESTTTGDLWFGLAVQDNRVGDYVIDYFLRVPGVD
jgi:hypothetical protein